MLRSRWILFIFFFQAEDGIRDLTVTGVQTCALPISMMSPNFAKSLGVETGDLVQITINDAARDANDQPIRRELVIAAIISPGHAENRSEERRVGKECRSRWSPYH